MSLLLPVPSVVCELAAGAILAPCIGRPCLQDHRQLQPRIPRGRPAALWCDPVWKRVWPCPGSSQDFAEHGWNLGFVVFCGCAHITWLCQARTDSREPLAIASAWSLDEMPDNQTHTILHLHRSSSLALAPEPWSCLVAGILGAADADWLARHLTSGNVSPTRCPVGTGGWGPHGSCAHSAGHATLFPWSGSAWGAGPCMCSSAVYARKIP